MSRIYDTPRYKNQSFYRILTHIDIYTDTIQGSTTRTLILDHCGNSALKSLSSSAYAYILGEYKLYDSELLSQLGEDFEEDDLLYHKYSYEQGTLRTNPSDHAQVVATGKGISDILVQNLINKASKNRKIWFDSDACYRLTVKYLSKEYTSEFVQGDYKRKEWASAVAKDLVSVSMAACRLGLISVENALNSYVSCTNSKGDWEKMSAWHQAIEYLKMRGVTPELKEANLLLRKQCMVIATEMFSIGCTRGGKTVGAENVYRILGHYILVYKEDIYVLDYSALEQVYACAKFWEGAFNYCVNYRISGTLSSQVSDMVTALKESIKWIVKAMIECNYDESLARSMKQSLAYLQNGFHQSAEKLEMGLEKRAKDLKEAINDILPLSTYWHEFIQKLGITDRAKLDIAHLYYGLPAPDCDLEMLIRRATEYMSSAKTADASLFQEFMNYCKALDFCKVLARVKSLDNMGYNCVDSYDPTPKRWFIETCKGNLSLPPDDEMGKIWLEHHFPYNECIHTWFYEAADVTHITSDISNYENLLSARTIERIQHNELLYALKYAPYLSTKWSTASVLNALEQGSDSWDRMAVMAAKSENTKPKAKVRETWSADDITRELTTMYDRQGIPLSTYYKGVTARKSDLEVSALFDRICEVTDPKNPKDPLVISNDITGWSPQGDRKAWSEHHDYVVQTTKAPKYLRLERIWLNMHACLSKRGLVAVKDLPKGLFQGWTATLDSLMNVRISLFCVRKAKRAGYLFKNEAATTAGLIDDAVQAVEMASGSSKEHAQKAANAHFETTKETWSGLAAELDTVKTIYSSSKFIYLNRFFCEGSEVITPLKIYARADRELKRRFATVFDQFDTILGSFRSASDRGACPLACYISAVIRCFDLAAQTSATILNKCTVKLINAAFAPRGLGGWGIPHVCSWLTQESPDPLVSYITTMSAFYEVVVDLLVKQKVSDMLHSTISQELVKMDIMQLLACPRSVVAKGVSNATGALLKKLKEGMLSRCESPIFRQALESGANPSAKEGVHKVVEACAIDANVLELLGQCLPENCMSAIIDRAYKNELIAQLFPFRVRDELSRIVRNGERASINHLVLMDVRESFEVPSRSTSFERASILRSAFYEVNGLTVVNHTLPDYNVCLSRQVTTSAASLVVKMQGPRSSCPTEGVDYHNLYDGINPHRTSSKKKTQSAYTFTSESFKTMNPIEKCVQKAAVIAAHISSKGGNGTAFWELVMAIWGLKGHIAKPTVTFNIKEGSSFKRISPSLTSRVHPIACFPNVQHCMEIDSISLGKYLSAYSTNTDFMSFVTAARCFGLLEYACSGVQTAEIPFAILPGNLPATDETTMKIIDDELYCEGIEQIKRNTGDTFVVAVKASFVSKEVTADEDDLVQSVEYSVGLHKEVRVVGRVHLKPGFVRQEITSGLEIAVPGRSSGPAVRIIGEEIRHRHGAKLATVFQKLCSKMGASQALVNAIILITAQQFKRVVPKKIIMGRWKDMGALITEEFPNWAEIWRNISSAARSCKSVIDDEVVDALFRHFDYNVKQAFKFLDPTPTKHSATVLGVLYMVSHGRFPTAESYTVTSALGPSYVAKCWRMASSRKRFLAGEGEWNNILMSRVYEALAIQASAYDSKSSTRHTVVLGAHQAIQSFLEEVYDGSSEDLFDFPISFLVQEKERRRYYSQVSNIFQRIGGRKRFDQVLFTRDMENIVQDVLIIGELRLVGALGETCAPFVDPTAKPEPIYQKHLFEDIIIREQEVRRTDFDQHSRKVVSAYIQFGPKGVSEYFDGLLDVEMCDEEDMDMYDEAVESYNYWKSSREQESNGREREREHIASTALEKVRDC
jgi:hypothetical protein